MNSKILHKPYQNIVPSPCYVCEEELLERNLKLLKYIEEKSKVKILVALKGFAMYSTFPLLKKYISGASASGINEAKLACKMNKEVHTFCPAIKDNDFDQLCKISNHLIFNSFSQWSKFKKRAKKYPNVKFGIRINPEYSNIEVDIYNPCALHSRLGVTKSEFKPNLLKGISGLHFHALCEQDSYTLEAVLDKFEKNFGVYLSEMKWVNFGGGHHITKKGYDVEHLISVLKKFKKKYNNIEIYLEPGEAIGWQVGTLVGEVVDIVKNGIEIAILDVSASTHMPDILEMPYRPEIYGASKPNIKKYNYRLAGPSCLAGDIIGDYSFAQPLKIGQRIIFDDMIHYTMVKNTTFNGINLPSIAIWHKNNRLEIIKQFGYKDFKSRL